MTPDAMDDFNIAGKAPLNRILTCPWRYRHISADIGLFPELKANNDS